MGSLTTNRNFAGRLDIRNNVVYNFGGRVNDGGAHKVNFVGNVYKQGPASSLTYAMKAQVSKAAVSVEATNINNPLVRRWSSWHTAILLCRELDAWSVYPGFGSIRPGWYRPDKEHRLLCRCYNQPCTSISKIL